MRSSRPSTMTRHAGSRSRASRVEAMRDLPPRRSAPGLLWRRRGSKALAAVLVSTQLTASPVLGQTSDQASGSAQATVPDGAKPLAGEPKKVAPADRWIGGLFWPAAGII